MVIAAFEPRSTPLNIGENDETDIQTELAEARHMIAAAIRKSAGATETVCVTDDGGYPLALER